MDTKRIEMVAEDRVSHELQQAGMLVAKPKFDVKGTDLLAFVEMHDGVKFCRIQCKARSIAGSRSSISIPCDYVTDGFVVALWLDAGQWKNLYCFFASDIRQWHRNKRNQYRLPLNPSNAGIKLAPYQLDQSRIKLIETLIQAAEVSAELRRLVHGTAHVNLQPIELSGYGRVFPSVPSGAA
jgi:hypothetical protein